jgi:type IV pilus assembly protein PilM
VSRFNIQVPIGVAPGGRPAAALEISPEAVVAAATPAAGQAAVYAAEMLPPLTVMPGLEANLGDSENGPARVSAAIRAALGAVEPRVKSVTVVVPDAAVRVFVLDFDTLPARQDEALPVLRFRLRKSVPFDVEEAGISYQVLSEGSPREGTQWKVLAAVMPGPVLDEYEAAVRGAGYEPGVVMPASLAVLAGLSASDSQEAVLAVNLSAQSLTTTIVAANDMLLYRTVELPADPEEYRAEVQRSIAVAGAFFEDKLQVRPHRVLYSGVLPVREFAELLDDPALAVGEAVPRRETGMATAMGHASIAAVTGALMGTN